jgi:signal transduction histidine kinase
MSDVMDIMFVGADSAVFSSAADALAEQGHRVRCVGNAFKALTANTVSPADLTVVDASRLDDQMLDVFESLKEVAPESLLLAAVAASARGRAASVLNLGSDAIIGLPADAAEIQALISKRRGASPAGETTTDEKLEWLGGFAAGVAHNINNPLTTVVGYLQILCSQVESNGKMGSVLPTMLKECDRISDIVKNLLLFSGSGNIEPRAVDVNRAVDAALLVASATEENDKIQVERRYQPGLPTVMADEESLKLACEGIVINARQAMRDGGTLAVETVQNGSGRVQIRFTDSGPGVPPGKAKKIFEPFYTDGNNGHVGLGLATSYGIVKALGGTIRVESAEGEGATFAIELPAGA